MVLNSHHRGAVGARAVPRPPPLHAWDPIRDRHHHHPPHAYQVRGWGRGVVGSAGLGGSQGGCRGSLGIYGVLKGDTRAHRGHMGSPNGIYVHTEGI